MRCALHSITSGRRRRHVVRSYRYIGRTPCRRLRSLRALAVRVGGRRPPPMGGTDLARERRTPSQASSGWGVTPPPPPHARGDPVPSVRVTGTRTQPHAAVPPGGLACRTPARLPLRFQFGRCTTAVGAAGGARPVPAIPLPPPLSPHEQRHPRLPGGSRQTRRSRCHGCPPPRPFSPFLAFHNNGHWQLAFARAAAALSLLGGAGMEWVPAPGGTGGGHPPDEGNLAGHDRRGAAAGFARPVTPTSGATPWHTVGKLTCEHLPRYRG